MCHCLHVRGQCISSIAESSSVGVVATEFQLRSVSSDGFYDFVHGSLIPNMHPYDGSIPKSVALMHNCSFPIIHVCAKRNTYTNIR